MLRKRYIINRMAELLFTLSCLLLICLFLFMTELVRIDIQNNENTSYTETHHVEKKYTRKPEPMILKEKIAIEQKLIASEAPIQEAYTIEAPEIIEEQLVQTTNRWGIASISEEERTLLAKVIYLEGHNTGLDGCQKIAVVIFNRYVNGGFFGNKAPSLTAVVSKPGQFSVYHRAANDPNVVPTEQEYLAIDSVLNGSAPNEILNGRWLYFNGDGHRNHFR